MGNSFKKSKLRKIVVGSEEYYWGVGNKNCDGDGGCELRIYKNKKLFHREIVHNTVTPKTVECKIYSIYNPT